ncbi:MAG: hypothetical protein ACHQ1D_02955 [Nitrososphaerales archaeon]
MCLKNRGYCSKECKYSALSERMKHEFTLGIRKTTDFLGDRLENE